MLRDDARFRTSTADVDARDDETAKHNANDRSVVIVSPYFPPSTLAGVHRARHLAKHLSQAGWTPIVLCVGESYYEERLDPTLSTLVPGNVEIVKVGALPAWLTRCVGIGELSLRAWRPLKRGLFRLLDRRSVGAVLITGSPYYPMLLAPEIKRRFGVPVVLDFQDPWVSAWGATQNLFSKAGVAHRLAAMLEPRALRAADFVTSVSDTQNAEMAARYSWLDAERMQGVPIGGDPDDFVALGSDHGSQLGDALEPGLVHLSYVGTFLPKSGALVRALFRSFARLRSQDPALAARIRLHFIGTSNQPNDHASFRLRQIAEEEGITEAVHEIPQRLPFFQALNWLSRSNGVLLIGSDEPHYTASKIYPALMCGRPFLSLFHRASSAHAILSAAGGGCALAFTTHDDLSSLEPQLAEALRTLALSPEILGTADPAAYAPYEARAIAKRFAGIFDRLAAERAGRPR